MKHLSKLFLFVMMACLTVACGDDDDYDLNTTQLSHTYEVPIKGHAGQLQTSVQTTLVLADALGSEIAGNLKSAAYQHNGSFLKISGLSAYGPDAEIKGLKIRFNKGKDISLGDCRVNITNASNQIQSDVELSTNAVSPVLQGLFSALTTSSRQAEVYLTYTTNVDTETDKPITFEFTLNGQYIYKVYK